MTALLLAALLSASDPRDDARQAFAGSLCFQAFKHGLQLYTPIENSWKAAGLSMFICGIGSGVYEVTEDTHTPKDNRQNNVRIVGAAVTGMIVVPIDYLWYGGFEK